MTYRELNTRAFLSTIKRTENAGGDPLPYNSWNGFVDGKLRLFTTSTYEADPKAYSAHPGKPKNKKGEELASSAAGAYQILRTSFNAYQVQDKSITDFSPTNQDKVVMDMIAFRNALDDVAKANLTEASRKLTIRRGGEQFASLPGGSQSHIQLSQLEIFF